jgi:hypothetical protein
MRGLWAAALISNDNVMGEICLRLYEGEAVHCVNRHYVCEGPITRIPMLTIEVRKAVA